MDELTDADRMEIEAHLNTKFPPPLGDLVLIRDRQYDLARQEANWWQIRCGQREARLRDAAGLLKTLRGLDSERDVVIDQWLEMHEVDEQDTI